MEVSRCSGDPHGIAIRTLGRALILVRQQMTDRALGIVEGELETVRTEREVFTRFLDRIQYI